MTNYTGTNRRSINITFAANTLAAFVLGLFIAVCFLFDNDEIFENTNAFWMAIFGG